MTQGRVADALEWSLSKVNRIESGEVAISNTDLRALLGFLEVTDPEVVDRLTEDARTARRRGPWDDANLRQHHTPATVQMLQFESQATAIRSFQPTLVPGLLQTRAYAETVINFWDDLPAEDRIARLDLRMKRKARLFERPDPPDYLVILDESVLMRKVGGAQIMAEQLDYLLSVIHPPKVTVRIVPLAQGAQYSPRGAFTVFDLIDAENAVLYTETYTFDTIIQAPDTIGSHRQVFEQMWESSLGETATVRLVADRVASLRNERAT